MKKNKRRFTIIELLVVVAIIGVLMGMLLPAVSAVRQNARKTRAKSEINAIVSAIKLYEQTYGYLPFTSNPTSLTNYRLLMEYLTNYPGPGNGASASTFVANPRAQRFLDAPSNYKNDTTARTGAVSGASAWANYNGDYADPWGSFYQIYLDTDYDGVVDTDIDTGLNGTVFVYSVGPDQKKGTSTTNKDNIYSWK